MTGSNIASDHKTSINENTYVKWITEGKTIIRSSHNTLFFDQIPKFTPENVLRISGWSPKCLYEVFLLAYMYYITAVFIG